MRTIKRKDSYFIFIILLLTSIIISAGCGLFGPNLVIASIDNVEIPSNINYGENLNIKIKISYSERGKYSYHHSDIEYNKNLIKITPYIEETGSSWYQVISYSNHTITIENLQKGKYTIEFIQSSENLYYDIEIL